jgi:predicted flavoprotein YhiN
VGVREGIGVCVGVAEAVEVSVADGEGVIVIAIATAVASTPRTMLVGGISSSSLGSDHEGFTISRKTGAAISR